MHLFYVVSLFIIGVASECNRDQTQINEGTRQCCYNDTKGIPTIGVGFNLQRSDAATVLSKYGLRLAAVLNDCQKSTKSACLTKAQATDIFQNQIYPEASACASKYAPRMPTDVHAALTDVAFAGCQILNQFVKMRAALLNGEWQKASNELRTSKWCADVRSGRCGLNVACIASGT